jgi:hypothetical protein
MKSAVGICARHEHKYIQECLCFNYLQGWDRIVVCIHHQPDDPEPDFTRSKIEQLPKAVLEKITVIDVVGEPGWGPQHKAYHLILQLVSDYEWLGMFDVDEYLCDSQHRNINDMLSSIPEDAGQIIVPWVEFGHNNRVLSATPEETRLSVFTKRADLCSRPNFKSIVRPRYIVQNPNQYAPSNYWYYCHFARVCKRHVNFQGEDVLPPDWWFDGEDCGQFWNMKKDTTCFDPCLVHYFTGSMEDWVIRLKRTRFYDYRNLDAKDFIGFTANVEDTRMSIYVDELRGLLAKIKQ